jgi:hypothetical protein
MISPAAKNVFCLWHHCFLNEHRAREREIVTYVNEVSQPSAQFTFAYFAAVLRLMLYLEALSSEPEALPKA